MTFAKTAASVVLVAGVTLAFAAHDGPARSAAEQPPRPKATAKSVAPKATSEEATAAPGTELTGTWTVTWAETSGQAIYDAKTRDVTLPPPTFVFTADKCQVNGLRVLHLRDFAYKLDPKTTPKEIDATMLDGPKQDETVVGIYVVRGDELRICLRLQRPDLGRPKGYVTNSGTTLYTFILTRGVSVPSPGAKSGATVPAALTFDAVLKSGNRLYLVLDGADNKTFPDELAPFAQRLDLAVKTADRLKDKDLSVVLFRRIDRQTGTGSYSGFTPSQLREYSAHDPDRRVNKLAEHAWVLGRLPKDAVPLPPEPPTESSATPRVGPGPGATGEQPLSVAELAALVTGEKGNPTRAYGKTVEFTARVETVGKGVDGGTVPLVTVEGWPDKSLPYGEVFVHNVFPDRAGKAGDRVRVRGRVVSHGYGTLTVWAERWTREEVSVTVRDPAPKEVSIYDRVHPKADLPGPGAEVRDPKDRSVVYYYTSSLRMWGEPKNAGKHPGLYTSRDGGTTWKLTNTSLEIKSLFAHPQTGHLFAVVEHSWLGSDEKDGQVHRYHADKAVTSTDGGVKWKDITPPPGYIADINIFFADPDHSGRACFVATRVRGIIFRPTDDRYSEYDHIREASPEGVRLVERGMALVRP